MIDSHAHLTDERLLADVPDLLRRARDAGVHTVISIATDVEDSGRALELARTHEGVYCTAGIHPHAAEQADDAAFARLAEYALAPEVVAVGETGLDYFYDSAPREQQRRAFARHLELGARTNLPVIVHGRDADEDLIAMLADAPPESRGVLHCFAGSDALLDAALAHGWYISFSGMVTFAKYDRANAVRAVPLNRLLVETDSPYLAPVPHRGKRNEPAYVVRVAERVAELRGEDRDEVAAAIVRNARNFYRLAA